MELDNLPPIERNSGWTGLLPALAQTWFGACFRPKEFFGAVGNSQKLGRALLFGVLVGWAATELAPRVGQESPVPLMRSPGIMHGSTPLSWGYSTHVGEKHIERHAVVGHLSGGFLAAIRDLIGVFGGVFITGLILHLILKIFGGAKQGLPMTLRVLCYSYAPATFAVLPIVGTLIAGGWMLVVAIIGLAAAHRTNTWRAALAVLCPGVPILVLFALLNGIHIHLGHLAGFDAHLGSAGH